MRVEEIRTGLATRLRARRPEMEQAAFARIDAVGGATETEDPEYAEGLRAAVCAALDYGIKAVERGEDRAPPVPGVLLTQARLAARNGVSLDTVMRRYFAGHALLGDFLVQESENGTLLTGTSLKRVLRVQASVFDRLLLAVSEEYMREAQARPSSSQERLAGKVSRLLTGELLDTSELDYEFDANHLAMVASGQGAEEAIRSLATSLGARLLLVHREADNAWAWLGASRVLDIEQLGAAAAKGWTDDLSLAIGEPAAGFGGWRLSHRQARAAFPIALRGPQAFVRYADVALLASVLQDDLLSTSLHQIFLEPLEHQRDGGALARETLRAYFASEQNISSAAVVLGVKRHTVTYRLRGIEKIIARPLHSCTTELAAALRMEELDPPRLAATR